MNISTKKGKLKLLKKHPLLFFNIAIKKIRNTKFRKPIVFDYERTCKKMTTRSPYFRNSCPGIFTSWDKTPRNGSKATIYKNSTPKAFGEFLKKQAERAKNVYHTEYLFVTAWNEWGEGAYLEPDKQYGMNYLDAMKESLK